jgi:hypothetical protein
VPREAPGIGLYGLALTGLPLGDDAPTDVPADWPPVAVSAGPAGEARAGRHIDGDSAALDLVAGRSLVLTRAPASARFLGAPLPPDELAHPYLVPVATVFARWHGHEAFHGGAFDCGDGRAIAVLGDREAGKSTLLAALAADGAGIVADDMLVMRGGRVCRGPRTLDLRAEPAPQLRGDLTVSRARERSRWRLSLPPIAPELELAGWVFLGTGPTLELTPIDVRARLTRLAQWRAWRWLPSDPAGFLDLAALPAWTLTRPLTWDALPDTVAAIRRLAPSAEHA